MSMTSVLLYCFYHFYGLDRSNAAMHTAPVRFSPITFRLAEILTDRGVEDGEVDQVMEDKGMYEEDGGR